MGFNSWVENRHLPRPSELKELMVFRRPVLSPRKRRLERALTIGDLRTVARRRTPRAVFDYVDGAADAETSLARARSTYARLTFHPRVLRDVASVDLTTKLLDRSSAMPFGIAPTGFTRMMHPAGERAMAAAAAAAGIPFGLSTMGTTSIEQVADAAPSGWNWFQLYVWKNRDQSLQLLERAAASGVDTLVVTVDVPVGGARLRDVRNGMTIPPTLSARTILDAIPKPAWWLNFLTSEPLTFASLSSWSGTVAQLADRMFDPTVGYEDLSWLRSQWKGKLVVKGIQHVEDAVRVRDLGADGIILSNHGGRQLDRAPEPLRILGSVREAIGPDLTVMVDTGILNGQDIVAALAHGADFVLVGRATLYGLMAGGRPGVDRALSILRGELERTMRLLGVTTVRDLRPEHVTLPPSDAA
jgi:L-lactate dehydrogenase (cytochrome)